MGSVTYVMPGRTKAPDWISRLHQAHGAQLQQFLTRMTGSPQAAEEIAQETYLKLYRLCRPEEVTCPRALLFDAATKLAITHLRRRRAESAVTPSEAEAAGADEVPDDLARPDRRAAAEQALKYLAQEVERLPANLQTVFTMRYVRQMPRQEIAEQLQISVNAVEQRLTRALTQCRTRLAALGLDWPAVD
jgi:RNA polymerase sigma factor (sigma-70 family)